MFTIRPKYPYLIGIDTINFYPFLRTGTDTGTHARARTILIESGSDAIRTGSQFDG
jgi:hypothetical protein